jgi:hypothetical protein
MSALSAAVASLLATILVLAAAGKARQPIRSLEQALESLGWIPRPLLPSLARMIPALEIGCALLLLIPATRWSGALLSAGLLSVFAVTLLHAVVTKSGATCACFGNATAVAVSWPMVPRNFALALLSVFLLVAYRPVMRDDTPALLVGFGAGVILVLVELFSENRLASWLHEERLGR